MADEKGAAAQASPEAAAGKTGEQAGAAAAATDAGKTGAAAAETKTGAAAAGDGKTTADGKQETGSKAGEGTPQPKAPAKYELTVPEGGDAYIGEADLEFIQEAARANDWTNEEAQTEINAAVERAKEREKKQADGYLTELKADEDYGGKKLDANRLLISKAIDRVYPVGHKFRERFLKTVNREVIGNNPVIFGFLTEIGRMLGEDSPGIHRSASGGGGDAASKLYDHPTSKAADQVQG